MAYTKAEAVEQIYLAIHGGQPSPDVNVRREDIPLYLAAAINYVLTSEIRARKKEERIDGWLGGASGIDPEFLATYYLTIEYDDQRDLKYAALPVKLASLPANAALSTVAPLQGELPFVKMKGQYEDVTVRRIMPNNTRYWYEKIAHWERIYFTNISPIIETVMARLIASIDDLADDDVLPIPNGMDIQVMSLVKDWFSGQRQMPADMLNNNKDDKR